MRCLTCEGYSFSLVCSSCQKTLLTPKTFTRTLPSGVNVTSFYPYHEIASLLHTKHTFIGHEIFTLLARHSFKNLSQTYQGDLLHVIPIDDHVRHGYSHTAILAHATKSQFLHPIFGSLRSSHHETYSGQSLEYRLQHKRDFIYTGSLTQDVILVDDIVTTGSTLNEAISVLTKEGINVFHAFVLADASREG